MVHFSHVQVRDSGEAVVQEGPLDPATVPTGPDTAQLHLNTQQDIDCVNCFQPFFRSVQSLKSNSWMGFRGRYLTVFESNMM